MAEKLAVDLKGRIKLEDAGFDWKVRSQCAADHMMVVPHTYHNCYPIPPQILGPDVGNLDYVAWTCDQVRDSD